MGQILFTPSGAGVTSDDVTATKAQVLSGYTALTSDSDDEAASGSMTNNGAWTSSSSGSGKITIPAGYHNGSGYVDCSGAYNKGVTDADNRANSNSANYKAGYTNGKAINRVVASKISGSHTLDISGFNDKSADAFVISLPQSSNGSWTLTDWGGQHTNKVYINISKSVSGKKLTTNVIAGLNGNNVPFSYSPVYNVYYIGKI